MNAVSAKADLNDLEADIHNQGHLLDALYEEVTQLDFVLPDGSRNLMVERICAFAIIVRDMNERMVDTVAACHSGKKGGRS